MLTEFLSASRDPNTQLQALGRAADTPIDVDTLSEDRSKKVKRKKSRKRIKPHTAKTKINAPPKANYLEDIDIELQTIGRPTDKFLDATSQLCEDPCNLDEDGDPVMWFRCKGTDKDTGKRCAQVWAVPRQLRRVAEHIKDCQHTNAKLRGEASTRLARLAPGTKAEKVHNREAALCKEPGTTIDALWKKRSDDDFEKIANLAVVKLICGLGLSPYLVDSVWWKEFIREITCSRYGSVSGTTLTESHIAGEAAHVRDLTVSYLKSASVCYTTVGFDGGATRRRHSFLTIHATDQNKRAHFLNAVNTSGTSHTGDYYAKLVLEVRYCLLNMLLLTDCGISTSRRLASKRWQVLSPTTPATPERLAS